VELGRCCWLAGQRGVDNGASLGKWCSPEKFSAFHQAQPLFVVPTALSSVVPQKRASNVLMPPSDGAFDFIQAMVAVGFSNGICKFCCFVWIAALALNLNELVFFTGFSSRRLRAFQCVRSFERLSATAIGFPILLLKSRRASHWSAQSPILRLQIRLDEIGIIDA